MSRKIFFVLLGVVVVISMVLTACGGSAPAPTAAPTTAAPTTSAAPKTTAPATSAAPAPTTATPAKTYTLKAISFAARNIFSVSGIFTLADKVKELSKGQLTIQYMGGPEIIPVFQQAEAVRKNVVNMSVIPATMYDGLVPLGNLMEISELTFEEELKAGVIDYYNTLHEKAGLHLLGYATHAATPSYHTMILNKLITKPQELAGVKMGAGSTLLVPFLKSVGAVPVIVPLADVYTNLERKVMDGYSVPITNHADLQLHEVTKYIIDHNFYQAAGVFIISMDAWNSLPKEMQNVMVEAAKLAINKYTEDYKVQQAAARKKLMDGGMKTITFSDADLKWFIDKLYSTAWEENAKLVPEQTAKLRPLIQKSGR
jgi:TRAP-type C4-dicarboxylate transport system substrate-binding protein